MSVCLGGASMKLEPEDQEVTGWGDDEDLVIDEGRTVHSVCV